MKLYNSEGKEIGAVKDYFSLFVETAFSSDEKFIALADDRRVVVWDIESKRIVREFSFEGYVSSIRFYPQNNILVVTESNSETASFWNFEGENVLNLKASEGSSVNNVAISGNGQRISVLQSNGFIQTWKLVESDKFEKTDSFRVPDEDIEHFSMSFDGLKVVTGSEEKIYVWSADGKLFYELPVRGTSSIRLSPSGNFLAASSQYFAQVWDLQERPRGFNSVRDFIEEKNEIRLYDKWFKYIDYVDRVLFLSGSKAIYRLNISKNELLEIDDLVREGSFGSEGISLSNGQIIETFLGDRRSLFTHDVKVSPDGKMLAVSEVNRIELWDIESKERLSTLYINEYPGFAYGVRKINFWQDEKIVGFTSNGSLIVWDYKQSDVEIPIVRGGVYSKLSVSQDSEYIALSSGGDLLISSASSMAQLEKIDTEVRHDQKNKTIEVTPFGGAFFSSGLLQDIDAFKSSMMNSQTLVGNCFSEKNCVIVRGHNGAISDFEFVDQKIITASLDGTVKVWTLRGDELFVFKGLGHPIKDIGFDEEFRVLLATDNEGNLMAWNLDIDDLLLRSCKTLKTYLSEASLSNESDRRLCDSVDY